MSKMAFSLVRLVLPCSLYGLHQRSPVFLHCFSGLHKATVRPLPCATVPVCPEPCLWGAATVRPLLYHVTLPIGPGSSGGRPVTFGVTWPAQKYKESQTSWIPLWGNSNPKNKTPSAQ